MQAVDDEVVVVLPEAARFMVLNASASYLLSHLHAHATIRSLAADLAARYDLSQPQAERDTLAWAQDMIAAGICIHLPAGD